MTELYPPVPYVTGATLNRYQGRTVRLLGSLSQTHPDGTRFTIDTVDGASITIIRLPGSPPIPSNTTTNNNNTTKQWAVVTGVVQPGELSVQENIVDWVESEVDQGFAKQVIGAMQKMPALFAA